MGDALIEEFLAGDSKEIRDIANNEAALVGFLTLAKGIDDLPDMNTRFYEAPRSLYQVTSSGHSTDELMGILTEFFGSPAKAPGKSLPVNLRFDPTVKYLGGIRKDQVLYLKKLKTGAFYAALWPWQRDANKIEVLLGFCSSSMSDADYNQLGNLVQKFISKKKIETISEVGGQIHGISLPSFLQMSEMEGATYTLKVTSANRTGYLYLDDGSLIAARYEGQTGNDAAFQIISWDNAAIQIEPADSDQQREIHDPLMHVMMESLKIKDEAGAVSAPPSSVSPAPPVPAPPDAVDEHTHQPIVDVESKPPPTPEKKAPPAIETVPITSKPVKQKPTAKAVAKPAPDSPASTHFKKPEDHSMGKQAQMSRTTKLLIVLGVVIVFAITVTVGGKLLQKRQLHRRYDQLIADLAVTKALDAQIVLLMQYLKLYPDDVHRSELEARMDKTNAEIEKQDYDKTILDVNRLPIDDKYEKKALSLYIAFLAKHPQSVYVEQINEAIKGIRQLLGTASFEDLKKVTTIGILDRNAAYREYLEQFPQGTEREVVERMIGELAQEYLDVIKEQIATCDAQENWDGCIAECDRFLSAFSSDASVEQVKQLRSELEDKKALVALRAEADRVSEDYDRAKRVYTDYLNQHPDTTQKEAIFKRIDALNAELSRRAAWEKTAAYATNPKHDIFKRIQRLDLYIQKHASKPYTELANNLRAQLEPELQETLRVQQVDTLRRQALARKQAVQARRADEARRIQRLQDQVARQLDPVSSRFIHHQDGTFSDQVTGLTWCLLDSHLDLGHCLSYREAKTYVQGLATAGHSNWRLPTAGELASLYKNRPFFPGSGAAWYWTSETFARGYHRVVDVVTSVPETVFTRISKSEDRCGAVRAVR